MRRPRNAVAHIAAILALTVIIIAAAGIIWLSSQNSSSRATSTQSSTVISSQFADGLSLQIKLSTISLVQNSAMTAQVLLVNTLPSNLSLTPDFSTYRNLSLWDSYNRICAVSGVYDVFGFAIFQGRYDSANLSSAGQPLSLIPPAGFGCGGAFPPRQIRSIVFAPNSDTSVVSANSTFNNVFTTSSAVMEIDITTGGCNSSSSVVTVTTTSNGTTSSYTTGEPGSVCGPGTTLTGFWTSPPATDTSTCCQFHPFPTGEYTIAARDMWNQTVFAYFWVAPSGQP